MFGAGRQRAGGLPRPTAPREGSIASGPAAAPGGPRVLAVFQPIVDLRDGSVVAVEALARGGAAGDEPPARLFARAAGDGSLEQLDEQCLRAGLLGAAPLDRPATLFLNIEPTTLAGLSAERLDALAALAPDGLQVVLEVTERHLLERPADLVRAVRRVRDLGWGVALDDVGADPAALALMPFLRPDVIKLDLALVRGHTTLTAAAVINAVRAEAERSDAVVLAEGIETGEHLDRALAMGARLGQGWLFGRPGPLDGSPMQALRLLGARPAPVSEGGGAETPFTALTARSPAQRAGVTLLTAMTSQLENQALLLDDQTVVLANFQATRQLTARTRRRYESLAAVTALTAVTGPGMPLEPVPGVHGTPLDPRDPVAAEWVVAVLSPHFAAALAARDLGEPVGAPAGRRLEYVLTYDRQAVVEAAGLLLQRVRPRPARPGRAAWSGRPRTAVAQVRVPAGELPDLLLRAITTASSGIVIADARAPDQPVVYVNEAFLRMTGYEAGEVLGRNCRMLQGTDTDPVQVRPLRRQILAGRDVHTVLLNYRKDGTPFWNELRVSSVHAPDGELTHYIGHQLDVTGRVDREQRTAYLAYHDELTGVPNRPSLLEHLDLELRRARRSGSGVGAVLLDLDGFKAVNDRLGHASGDRVLVWAAARLREAVRSGDLLGRLGGDEFLVVLPGLPAPADSDHAAADAAVESVVDHLRTALDEPLVLGGTSLRLGFSAGTALFPRDADDPAGLVAHADAAMYRAKRHG